MDLGLTGKSVLITGASKGIGLACAHSFAAEGCDVHLAARSAALLATRKQELNASTTSASSPTCATCVRKAPLRACQQPARRWTFW